jgi:hypothetical protein
LDQAVGGGVFWNSKPRRGTIQEVTESNLTK